MWRVFCLELRVAFRHGADIAGPLWFFLMVITLFPLSVGPQPQVLAKDKFTLKEAAMTARRSWQLTLNNGIKLNLGRGDTMKRLARFVELYPVLQQQAQTDGKRISYVDLRYDSGAAVGWAPLPPEESNQQQNQAQAEQQ